MKPGTPQSKMRISLKIELRSPFILSFRAIDTLLNQMSLNMDEVQGLRHGLEDRISKHVDVREALLKKKDEQLQGKISTLSLVNTCRGNHIV